MGEAFSVLAKAKWWCRQPCVAAKSGWLTTLADSEEERLTYLQTIACRLALVVDAARATHDEGVAIAPSAPVRPDVVWELTA